MTADLALLDRTIDAGIKKLEASEAIHPTVEKDIKDKSFKNIAGFRVFDEEHAESLKAEHVKERRESLARFYRDRAVALDKSEKAGVTPLAVLPTKAWEAICDRANLIRLSPDRDNRVKVNCDAIRKYKNLFTFEKSAKKDWPGFLKEALTPTTNTRWGMIEATIALPVPPADVRSILVKSQKIGAHLKVAAVPEAIGFHESFKQLWERDHALRIEEQKFQEWLKNDPIVYFEEGCATAIIAQFGDFPVEKQVIEEIADSEYLIPAKLLTHYPGTPAMLQQYVGPVQMTGGAGGILGGLYGYTTTVASTTTVPYSGYSQGI